ncbi:TPA: hypothetical protein HA318_03040 [Candidatus Micrarchaeota archaeon]|nr:MAG: hypothetical protein AUJ65_01205 [Candidatus Micrarchaeota archaeon CG1_02_51_15]HII38955.1 hypothetical protein [Candidatus Micrarchaeota archaeon]
MAAKSAEERLMEGKVDDARRYADEKIGDARKYAYEAKDKFDGLVSEHPLAFVVGAFVGGLLLGKVLSDRR